MSEEAWAKARMWAFDKFEAWGGGSPGTGGEGIIRRVKMAEPLARWVMSGPHPFPETPEVTPVAEEPKA